jgi:hypothetical protein
LPFIKALTPVWIMRPERNRDKWPWHTTVPAERTKTKDQGFTGAEVYWKS